jgi:aspartate aminotransferase
MCEKKGIFMICDDIYHKLTFDRNRAAPAYEFTKRDIENSNVIVVNGVAKALRHDRFPHRLGGCAARPGAGDDQCVGPDHLVRVASRQAAAEGALNGLQSVVEALRLQIQNNREMSSCRR